MDPFGKTLEVGFFLEGYGRDNMVDKASCEEEAWISFQGCTYQIIWGWCGSPRAFKSLGQVCRVHYSQQLPQWWQHQVITDYMLSDLEEEEGAKNNDKGLGYPELVLGVLTIR